MGAAKRRATSIAEGLGRRATLAAVAMRPRLPVDEQLLDEEAVSHASCLRENRGMTRPPIAGADAASLPQIVPAVSRSPDLPVHSARGATSATVTVSHLPLACPTAEQLAQNVVMLVGGDHFCRAPLSDQLQASLRSAAYPLVAAVRGATRGDGIIFLCAAAVVVAHADATFGFPELRRGSLPGDVSFWARERLSDATSRRLCCTGDKVSAVEAKRLGLVDVVVDSVRARCSPMADRSAPLTVSFGTT